MNNVISSTCAFLAMSGQNVCRVEDTSFLYITNMEMIKINPHVTFHLQKMYLVA